MHTGHFSGYALLGLCWTPFPFRTVLILHGFNKVLETVPILLHVDMIASHKHYFTTLPRSALFD